MCRVATRTPMLSAIGSSLGSVIARSRSDAELVRIPGDAELVGRRHVADERRCRHHGGAGEVTFAAQAHAVLPVAIERRDRALARVQRIGTLAEAGAAPRLTDLAADRAQNVRDRSTVEPRVGVLDLTADAAGSWKDHERLGRLRRA